MDIRQLKAFVAIAESGTFTAGAARVHVTQAAISMQIRQLENETHAQLFIRAPRRVILTEAGEKLLERAYTILREHDAALEELAALTMADALPMRNRPRWAPVSAASSSMAASCSRRIVYARSSSFSPASVRITRRGARMKSWVRVSFSNCRICMLMAACVT